MNNLKRLSLVSLVVILSLAMVACSVSAVTIDIQIAIDVIKVGTPIAAAFAGPGSAAVVTYMTAAANGLSCVLTAAEATGATTVTISAAFATCFAGAIVPVLPSGTPPEVAAIVAATSAALTFLINRYGPKATAVKGSKPIAIKLSLKDRRKIKAMHNDLNSSLGALSHAH